MPAANTWTRERARLTAHHLKAAQRLVATGTFEGRGHEWADEQERGLVEILTLARAYRPGAIIKAERVVDSYLTAFRGYRSRAAAIESLRTELSRPAHRAINRGGLFEQIERHLERRHREAARGFQ